MMRIVCTILSFLIPVTIFCQLGFSRGTVVDFVTREPVSYLTLNLYLENYANATISNDTFPMGHGRIGFASHAFPQLILSDTCISDANGNFKFSRVNTGCYTVISIVREEERRHFIEVSSGIQVGNDSIFVELTPRVFCEFDKYKGMDNCPECSKKDKLLVVRYGLPAYDPDWEFSESNKGEYWIGYCEKDQNCYARWYCSRCKKLF